MIELLNGILPNFTYCGIDIVEQSIINAKSYYPNSAFYQSNALQFETDETFDLVNATGVMQHEIKFEELVQRMIGWSNRYVLFDIKIADIDAHEDDITRSYCGQESKLPYVLLSLPLFLNYLKGLPNIRKISMYGYETSLNARTIIP